MHHVVTLGCRHAYQGWVLLFLLTAASAPESTPRNGAATGKLSALPSASFSSACRRRRVHLPSWQDDGVRPERARRGLHEPRVLVHHGEGHSLCGGKRRNCTLAAALLAGGGVEYNGPLASGTSDTGAATTSTPLAPTAPSMLYAAFLTTGEQADVLFSPCVAFLDECNDCSASMASAMPQISVGTEMRNVLHVLRTLSSNSLPGANSSEGCGSECSASRHEEAHCANYLHGCPDSVFFDPLAPEARGTCLRCSAK